MEKSSNLSRRELVLLASVLDNIFRSTSFLIRSACRWQ
jgi:hypothetical protein